MLKKFVQLSLLSGVLTLSACVSSPKVDSNAPEQQRSGRFAVLVKDQANDRNKDSVQGGFIWLDQHDRLQLDLTSPMGSTIARVQARLGSATLTDSSGQTLEANNIDDLVQQALNGSPLPVSGLRYWVLGQLMPSPAASNVQKDAQGRLQSFKQNGWAVKVNNYDAQGPKHLNLESQKGTLKYKVQINVD
ncbi:lipoprotein insertase outer membrane protein LolB [Brackiella oedipodis]|uniref:lipoprotein insertase outer membrane protein LolB n=1 Tax=Brackiella oedipodis TaxID=124225 RepID=UPI00056F7F2B|nr:lipoprotein insertase outer membrane protein LolB [Brackiella oedipodis]